MAGVRRRAFTYVGWKVTLCDPVCQVTSRSSEVPPPQEEVSAFTFYLFPVDGEAANLLLQTCRLCCGLVLDLLRGNWCNGFWP